MGTVIWAAAVGVTIMDGEEAMVITPAGATIARIQA